MSTKQNSATLSGPILSLLEFYGTYLIGQI